MSQQVKPTRSELIKLKQQIKTARSGYNLLKKKRDGLILEFFSLFKKSKNLRQELINEFVEAEKKMSIARAAESDIMLKSIAMAIHDSSSLKMGEKNIMGVVVPKIEVKSLQRLFTERGYGLTSGSSKIDDAAFAYEKVVELCIRAAEVETAIKRVLAEIEKTKRRVNALEFEVIPRMESTKKMIQLRLEEMERESTFRLKRKK